MVAVPETIRLSEIVTYWGQREAVTDRLMRESAKRARELGWGNVAVHVQDTEVDVTVTLTRRERKGFWEPPASWDSPAGRRARFRRRAR